MDNNNHTCGKPCDAQHITNSVKENTIALHTISNHKIVFVYLNNKEYIKRQPVVVNGFSVVNGSYMGSSTMLSGGIVFYPENNEYKMHYMKIVETDENDNSNTIIDILLDFEVLLAKAKETHDSFYSNEINLMEEIIPIIESDKNNTINETGTILPTIINNEHGILSHNESGDYYPIIIKEKNYLLCIKIRILHRLKGEYQISGISYKKIF